MSSPSNSDIYYSSKAGKVNTRQEGMLREMREQLSSEFADQFGRLEKQWRPLPIVRRS